MTILVADDDGVSRMAMEAMLLGCGLSDLQWADGGPAAQAALDGPQHFDLACLDLRMPAPDGLALAAHVRATPRLRRLPLVLITGSTDRSLALEATRYELDGFIAKPVNAATGERILRILTALDDSVLEPTMAAVARLGIDTVRHARYVGGLLAQTQALRASLPVTVAGVLDPAWSQKAAACRSAALTLGAPRIALVLEDAAGALRTHGDFAGAAGALDQALYWLGRVARARGLAA